MPRANSFSDDGRSLTPDLDEENDGAYAASPVSPIATEPTYGFAGPRPPQDVPVSRRSTQSPTVRTTFLTPKDRFRSTVKKVIHMHQTSSFMAAGRTIGAEPGVDPRTANANLTYGYLKQTCAIEIIDYSSVSTSFQKLDNREFVALLDKPDGGRPSWSKIRWINIGGMSWDVMSAVALHYHLHPLALEDVLSTRGVMTKRSKADYYKQHLFLRVQCHTLATGPEDAAIFHQEPPSHPLTRSVSNTSGVTGLPRSTSPSSFGDMSNPKVATDLDQSGTMYQSEPEFARDGMDPESAQQLKRKPTRLQRRVRDAARKQRVQALTVEELKKDERIHVRVAPMSIFLLRDGTIISMHPADTLDFTEPISTRLRSQDSVLRTSSDPSLLVHSLLDLIVDQSLGVVDQYHAKILKFEHDILVKPKVETVRYLHILSGDLMLLKRTLEPIKTMIYGLRRYDLDRCAALIDANSLQANAKVVGFMSHKSKIYLADVHDHMDYILTSLDMYATIAENLIDYTFNLQSYQMNQVMWRLTAVTIICLPLTLLTGYFGMNFEVMWAINPNRTDAIFWYFALPILAVLIPSLMYAEIKRAFRVLKDKILTKKIDKHLKDE